MADYAKPGDLARSFRSQAESNRRQRTKRPLNDQVPVLGWHIEGEISPGRIYGPYPLRVHPTHPEHKQLLGFDAWLEGGTSVTMTWQAYTEDAGSQDLVAEHVITAGITDNEILLDEPFIVTNVGDEPSKAWIRPIFFDAVGTPVAPLCLFLIVQTVPI